MPPTRKVAVSACYKAVQCNGIYKNLLTKILSGYLFAETRTSGGYPTLVYSILLNIGTKLELRKATHAAKLELLEATLVTLESYERRCTVLLLNLVPVLLSLLLDLVLVLRSVLPCGSKCACGAGSKRRA